MKKGKSYKSITGAILLSIMLLTSAAYSGIPEPGMILYGQVYDATGALVTSGELTWTVAPSGSGSAVTVSTELTELAGIGETFSYSVLVPFETAVPGHAVSAGALPLTDSPKTYTMTGVTGTGLSIQKTVEISTASRGTAMNVMIGSSVADVDGDGLPDEWEQAIVDADPNDNITSVEDVLPDDDFDGDGKTNEQEYNDGTDPTVAATYRLTTSISPQAGGSVTPECSGGCVYNNGITMTVNASENTGYAFSHWTGCTSSAGKVCTVTLNSNKNITAHFVLAPVLTKVKSYTEVFANHPGGRADGWYLHLSVDVDDAGGVPGNIQSVTAVNVNTGIDNTTYTINHSAGASYKKHPEYNGQSGTYNFTATNGQGNSTEAEAAPIDNPVQLPVIANLAVSDESSVPTFSFNPVAGADSYRVTIYQASDLSTKVYQSDLSNTPEFDIPSGVLTLKNAYYLKAEGLDYNTADSDGEEDLENSSVNYMSFTPTAQVTGVRILPAYAGIDSDVGVSILVNVTEGEEPGELRVNETIPVSWSLISASTPYSDYNAGTGIVSWLFAGNAVKDITIDYTVHVPADETNGAVRSFSGNVNYQDPDSNPVVAETGGDLEVEIGQTCHSYDGDCDWKVGDFELLDAIDDWAKDIIGDFDLLDLIDFWASDCYHINPATDNYMPGC